MLMGTQALAAVQTATAPPLPLEQLMVLLEVLLVLLAVEEAWPSGRCCASSTEA